MIRRGSDRYEVVLRLRDEVVASFFVNGFANASDATLEWLRGKDAKVIMDQFMKFILRAPVVQNS